MRSDVNAIAVGYHGKLDMFETIGFIQRATPVEKDEAEKPLREVFDDLFG